MAVNKVLLAGLLVFLCVSSVTTGTSPTVPDGVVYTEVKKTLIRGLQGKLTCRFYGEPWAVYWKRGYDPMDLDLLLVWHTGDVSGLRYDDGSCDIDDTFSLIIHNVSMIDAGRVYCIVSNYQGILLENYTDVSVTDTAIDTKPQVILEMGSGRLGILQCTVHIKARRVSWRRKKTSQTSESLVVLENNNNVAEISGSGYNKDMYNITEDYSLVIKSLQVHHEGVYICEVTDFDAGMSFRNQTLVSVHAQPLKPFPTIQECINIEVFDSHYCSLDATSEITLTCKVMEFYPEINLFFLHGSKVVEHSDTMEWNNTDGTKNKTVTIAARESKEPYTCVASNIPGSEERRSTSVFLHDEETFNSVLVIVLVCFAALILFSLMAYFIWRRKHRHDNHGNYDPVHQVELHVTKEVKDLTDEECEALLKRVNDALIKHYRRIHDLIDTRSTLQTEKIIDENREALFYTEQMLADWQQNPESTYDQYIKVIQGAISKEDKSDHAWPSNEELRWLSRHLNQESMTDIGKKLKITCKTEDTDVERNMFNSLRKWRNKVAHENVEKKHKQLSSAIGSKNLRGLLPPLRGKFIYKAELVDMAFNLLMHDLLPIAEALGINATKLVSYRPAFHPSHLDIGTIGLLSNLLNSVAVDKLKFLKKEDMRNFFYNEIGKLSYRKVASCGMVVYDMSYGELYAIKEATASTKRKASFSQALLGDTSKEATQSENGKREKGATSKIPENEKKDAVASFKASLSQGITGDTSKATTQSKDGSDEGAAPQVPEGENKKENNTENFDSVTLQPALMVSRNQKPELEKAAKDTETVDRRAGVRVVEISRDLVDLQHVLHLTDQDIADGGLGSSLPITAHALFKIWKETPRLSVFNYRAALAHELRGIQYPDLADEVIAGKYIKEQTSLTFVRNMVQGLSQEQLRSLGKLLGLSGKDEQWHTSTTFDVISKQICEWVTNWTKEMKKPGNVVAASLTNAVESFKEVAPKLPTTSEKHKDLNDKLVEQGFLDLAREIMIIEQQS